MTQKHALPQRATLGKRYIDVLGTWRFGEQRVEGSMSRGERISAFGRKAVSII